MNPLIQALRQPLPGGRFYPLLPPLFMALVAIGLWHHPLWFDELQNWRIILDSPTLPALFSNLKYEGHPSLWYLLLWALQWISVKPAMIKLAHWAVVSAAIAVVGYLAPLARRDRVLIMASYFMLYQWALISRNYAIGMLMAFLYAWLECAHPRRRLCIYLTLGLLANCSAFGLLLSVALVGTRALRAWRATSLTTALRQEAAGLALYVALVAGFIWTVLPPADMAYAGVGGERPTFHTVDGALAVFRRLIFDRTYKFGDEYYLGKGITTAWGRWVDAVLAVAAAALFSLAPFAVLWRDRAMLSVYALTFLIVFLFCFIVYQQPEYRHVGVLWLGFVTCFWLYRHRGGAPTLLATLYCGVWALWGAYSYAGEFRHPFANSEAMAHWVGDHGLADAYWTSYPDEAGVPLSAVLGIPTYSPTCQCTLTHVVWNRRRNRLLPSQSVGGMLLPTLRQHPVAYLVAENNAEKDPDGLKRGLDEAGIHYELLQRFTGATFGNYDLFRLTAPTDGVDPEQR
ncbi:hypothetical protein [Nitrospirillum iridis]|uniref:Glycosyltransferase RgtA/B/C/D-like domain-containing protein n=1 Tax=Nitrospirillum iridis TaxID=765888 RepID=A0A7X0ATG6_9PROT|nr:hypothetical protein [Nitrospirillum iridis]MBB6249788.1 hypothetical protein [Nitrospirillum iridis]